MNSTILSPNMSYLEHLLGLLAGSSTLCYIVGMQVCNQQSNKHVYGLVLVSATVTSSSGGSTKATYVRDTARR